MQKVSGWKIKKWSGVGGWKIKIQMERNNMKRKWTLCEHKVIIMDMRIRINVEEEQAEGFHLLMQEEILELLLDLVVQTVA